MMSKKTKLNLGCGCIYKPGYINIDKFDNSVADKLCDTADLPFKSNSVELIEAFQLIEHFDYIHCKYILSEWFRVLKPEGTLILETPDLKKTFKKFISADLKTKKTTLQWIYGIDSKGMQHKTGFTPRLLKDLLEEIGFENISEETPRTHKYEPGMRIKCKKPENNLEKQFFACFRKRLKTKLKIDDSYILVPLETWLKIFNANKEFKKNNINETINETIPKTAPANPLIPLAFLEECINFGYVKKSEVKEEINLIKHLAEIGFHKKIFSLWTKTKKNVGKEEFQNFIDNIESLISDALTNQNKERLKYIEDLESANIEIFDYCLVSLEAKKLFNIGIQQFYKKNFLKALDFFLNSSKINHNNPLAYWNTARLGCILKQEKHKIKDNYEKALSLMKNKENKRKIETELNYIMNGKNNLVQKEPVLEGYQMI